MLPHVLPTGLRRVRDHGFLHGKAKAQLTLCSLSEREPQAVVVECSLFVGSISFAVQCATLDRERLGFGAE